MKFQLTLGLLLVGVLQHTRAQVFSQFRQGDSIIAGQGCSQGFSRDYAFKPKDVVSYHYLDGDFGRDKFQAYAGGTPLPRLDPRKVTATFAKRKGVKEDSHWHAKNFLTDGRTLYYQSTLMQNADVNNIYFILDDETPLYQSNNNAYFGGHLLTGVNPAEIKLIEGSSFEKYFFFTDGKKVCRNEALLADADAKTFRMAEYNESKLEDGAYKQKKYQTVGIKIIYISKEK